MAIAPNLQDGTHDPQNVQLSLTTASFPDISSAPNGQALTHAWQPTHFSGLMSKAFSDISVFLLAFDR
jgi:hypothetical protein